MVLAPPFGGEMLIQFTRKVPPYNAGECAGFPDDEAKRFVRLGAAIVAGGVVSDSSVSVGEGYATTDITASQTTKKSGRKGR